MKGTYSSKTHCYDPWQRCFCVFCFVYVSVCVQGLALHQGTWLVDPEVGDFKRAVLPTHGAHFGVCG